ncbi:MAG: ORF6N domain-containing protein [Muribaculaceae bacterium]|nr:ORF6N domain-containing protein [Muribaculaceae bacterium]
MIRVIRGQQVMLDFDLAFLYGVETKALNQAVKRNINRFPEDFMFKLTKNELEILRSQIVTSNLSINHNPLAELSERILDPTNGPVVNLV